MIVFTHPNRRIAFTLALTAICSVTAWAEPRTWSDNTGKFSIEAELVEVMQDKVVLKKPDGSTISVPLARLSRADREYLKSVAKPGATTPAGKIPTGSFAYTDAMTESPDWNDANSLFDLTEFLKAPPEEENAAPLYLEALCEISPQDMLNILFPDMPEPELKERWQADRKLFEEQIRLGEAWEKDPRTVDYGAVDAWLAHYDAGMEQLAAAQQRPNCVFQVGRSLHSLRPHVHAAWQVSSVVTWRIRRDLQRGDIERPIQDLRLLLRLTRDWRHRGQSDVQHVSASVESVCCELTAMILNAPGIRVEHCDRLLTLLAEHEALAIDAYTEGNRADYICYRKALHDLQHRTGGFDPVIMRDEIMVKGDEKSPLLAIEIFIQLAGSYDKELTDKIVAVLKGKLLPGAWSGDNLFSDEYYAAEVDSLDQYFVSILGIDARRSSLREALVDDDAAKKSVVGTTLLAKVLISQGMFTLDAIYRNSARLRGTQCLVALRRWQLQHDDMPPDLETLVKAAGMKGVPGDPYSDQPLRLELVAGKPVVYSLGPDGNDDKALMEWDLSPDKPGDFIFQLDLLAP